MLKRLVILLLFVQVSYGQTKDGIELCLEYQKIVSGFTSEKEANEALDKILNVIGASKNFTLIPCDNINNALAITFKGDRYILFDSEFMNQITKLTNDWSSTFILAHEVGHHINGHTREALLVSVLDDITLEKKREEELEADEFASFILSKLGAPLNEIKQNIELIASNDDDTYSTHPDMDKRLKAIEKGFLRAKSTINKPSEELIIEPDIKNINSYWSYSTSTREDRLQQFDKIKSTISNPFEIKDKLAEIDKLPLKKRIVNASGISSDGKKKIKLNFEITKWGNVYGLSPDMLTHHKSEWQNGKSEWQPEILKKYSIDENFYLIKIEFIDDIMNIVEFPFEINKVIERNDYEIIYEDLNGQNKTFTSKELINDKYLLVQPNTKILAKLEYIIDGEEGFLWTHAPIYEFENQKLVKSEPDFVQTETYLSHLTIHKELDKQFEFYYKELNRFINLLKNGEKMYLRLTEVYAGSYKLNEIEYEESFNGINKTFYIFNLKGSKEALTLK